MAIQGKTVPRSNALWIAQYLPGWLNALLDAGITSDDPQVRRRQRFTNMTAYTLALDAGTHMAVNAVHDFWALLPVNVYNLAITVFYLGLHRLHRYGVNVVVNAMIPISLVGHAYVVFALGLDSGLHIYFTFAGFILFMVGTRNWRNFLALYGFAAAALISVLTLAGGEGFVMGWDHEFRESLAFQAVLSTLVINAAVIAYFLLTLERAETELRESYDRSEQLLHTLLPGHVAERLKSAPNRRIADHHENVAVLFADLVGFTPIAARTQPDAVVRYLHRLFSRFDDLCEAHGIDKIKTIGDSYMAVGGLRGDGGTGVRRAGRLALDMLQAASQEKLAGQTLTMRIGIHCGPVIAGIIGGRRMTYDVWGDTVNFASRLQSHSEPGRIHVGRACLELAGGTFAFEPRGIVDIKGFGASQTWFLEDAKDA
ncbi:MAG: adenylate/guanylate cyclase domain-containing protein [Pseudomonadota bacterium]|nr:adenylate/guanylate cyclase domain-containing protein [Pseudomonadota bacterium]